MARLGGLCLRPAPTRLPEVPSVCRAAGASRIGPALRSSKVRNNAAGIVNSPAALLPWLSSSTENAAPVVAEDSAYIEEDGLEYYEPKVGHGVIGAVVSGDSGKLDIDIGAKQLGVMFASNANPFTKFSIGDAMLDIGSGEESLPQRGKPFYVKDEEALETNQSGLILKPGSVVHALVIGVALSGSAVLSARNLAGPLVWQRIREIYKAEEVIQVDVESFNPGGLICRVEGLTAFLAREQIQNSPRDLNGLRGYVGKSLLVMITGIDEPSNRLILSERAAWVQQLVPPNTLVQGVVTKVEPYGVMVKIDGVEISALLHVSCISHKRVPDVQHVFAEGDRIKAIVAPPRNPEKVVLNTALLEREKGLILTNKQRVFEEAEEAFKLWREEKERYVSGVRSSNQSSVEEMAKQAEEEKRKQVANLDWLSFEEE